MALLAVLGLSLTRTSPASATPTARLVYSRTASASSCPDETALRRAVSARVGYDPFFPWARKTIVASMSASPSGGFVAQVVLVDEEGIAHGARELRTRATCADLLDPVALGIAIAIDPHAIAGPAESHDDQPDSLPRTEPDTYTAGSPHPSPRSARNDEGDAAASAPGASSAAELRASSAPTAPSPSVPDVAPQRPRASNGRAQATSFGLMVGAVTSLGVALQPAFGPTAGVEVRRGMLSVGLEGRVDLPSTASAGFADGATATSTLAVATLPLCAHGGVFFGCALGQAGVLEGWSAGIRDTVRRGTFWSAVGGRVGAEMPVAARFDVRAHGDLLVPLPPEELVLAGNVVETRWSVWRVAPSLGVEGVIHFR